MKIELAAALLIFNLLQFSFFNSQFSMFCSVSLSQHIQHPEIVASPLCRTGMLLDMTLVVDLAY
jgi:hypothetical protein